jgi:uncharacterized membrane protein
MLVAFPIGLWVFALVSDIVAALGGNSSWSTVALYCVGGGIVGAIIAAVPGFIDYFSIDETAMRRIAIFHLIVNLGALAVFALNLWSRFSLAPGSVVPLNFVDCRCYWNWNWRLARRRDGLRQGHGRRGG